MGIRSGFCLDGQSPVAADTAGEAQVSTGNGAGGFAHTGAAGLPLACVSARARQHLQHTPLQRATAKHLLTYIHIL